MKSNFLLQWKFAHKIQIPPFSLLLGLKNFQFFVDQQGPLIDVKVIETQKNGPNLLTFVTRSPCNLMNFWLPLKPTMTRSKHFGRITKVTTWTNSNRPMVASGNSSDATGTTTGPIRRVSAARARPSKCKTATSSLGRTIEIKAQRFRSADQLFWVVSCRASGWLTSSAISSSSARVHVTSSTRRLSGRFRRPLTQLGRFLCNSPLNRLMASWPSPIHRFRIPKIEQSTAGIRATSGQQFVEFFN